MERKVFFSIIHNFTNPDGTQLLSSPLVFESIIDAVRYVYFFTKRNGYFETVKKVHCLCPLSVVKKSLSKDGGIRSIGLACYTAEYKSEYRNQVIKFTLTLHRI